MPDLNLENSFTHEIHVVFEDGSTVIKEYDNVNIPADDLLEIVKTYNNCPNAVGIRVIRTRTYYDVVDIPFKKEN